MCVSLSKIKHGEQYIRKKTLTRYLKVLNRRVVEFIGMESLRMVNLARTHQIL